jgi:hypothetical protein
MTSTWARYDTVFFKTALCLKFLKKWQIMGKARLRLRCVFTVTMFFSEKLPLLKENRLYNFCVLLKFEKGAERLKAVFH